ncbi:MAG: 3-dehydroquinate synthase [Polyangiaceae bacterium]|nr:3-dehydroquinate synthase [Polyangiaceae bacterium]
MNATRRPIVLSGFMATGKSTVGRLVAKSLGMPFLDLDSHVEALAGKSVPEIFATEGEARFREREAAAILPLLDEARPRVIAFGGGTVTIERVRLAALERATVVTLTARPETIVSRVPSLAARPNLVTSSPLDRTHDLLGLRREAYGECHATFCTDKATPSEIASKIAALADRDLLAMPLGSRSYTIELANNEPARLSDTLTRLQPSSLVVVTDANVWRHRSSWLEQALQQAGTAGRRTLKIEIEPGEKSKILATVARIWNEALAWGIDRDAVVLAFGGGVVGDLAGFAASTLLRGVRCVQIATTLLSMCDSSVGGKTGFDHPAGKNLIGAFFQPNHVILDIAHLSTLPVRERTAGLAEVVKIAVITDAPLLGVLEQHAEAIAEGDQEVLRAVVRSAVQAKIRVVSDDERESGLRALLNLGHTVGHALEAHGGYSVLLHGEAVAIGTVTEMKATERLGLTPRGLADRAETLFNRLGLATKAHARDIEAAWPFVLADKKRAASTIKVPAVTGAGQGAVHAIEIKALADAVLAVA